MNNNQNSPERSATGFWVASIILGLVCSPFIAKLYDFLFFDGTPAITMYILTPLIGIGSGILVSLEFSEEYKDDFYSIFLALLTPVVTFIFSIIVALLVYVIYTAMIVLAVIIIAIIIFFDRGGSIYG